MLTDGTVWTSGSNEDGELGNRTNTASTTFVQGKTKEADIIATTIGRSSGASTSLDTVTIIESGRV